MHRDTFDYVIVGAGAAGAILANRLSEDGKHTVCLLEAGGKDWHPFLHIPAGFIKVLFDPTYTWQFSTEPTNWTNGRRVPIPQGRTLGGSTSINGLVYNRGQREDFDEWAALGNKGWSYAEVLPYFKRNEQRLGHVNHPFRSEDGMVPVSDIAWMHPICEQFIAGAQSMGMPLNLDYNGAEQAGVGYYQRTIQGRWRMSTARTYLRNARSRDNLAIRTNARATRLIFDGKRASAVRYVRGGVASNELEVTARREVIISAGAINTPKLLQISGVGPVDLLRTLGVPVIQDLPGVGENLTDHYSVRMVASARNIVTINELARAPRLWGQIWSWLMDRPNILALSPSLVHWFWYSRPGLQRPDLQGVFSPASYREGYVGRLDAFPGMTCGVWQHRPYSNGSVRIHSRDPMEAPFVQPNYLADERDQATLVGGMRVARRLLQTPELARYFGTETLPGKQVSSDDELLDFARRFGVSSYHVNGTARMGAPNDRLAVVDDELRVHGLQNLRIVDASVMPRIPSANTCAATMMIAEKASDLIRGRASLAPETTVANSTDPHGAPLTVMSPALQQG